MAKYKICPHCNYHNDTKAFECVKCEYSLGNVKPTDDENEAAKAAADSGKEDNQTPPLIAPIINGGGMTRICDSCGFHNPPNAQKCVCGEDISDVTPTTEDNVNKSANCSTSNETCINPIAEFSLIASDGYTFNICGDCIIGRENKMSDYLAQKPFVSRIHAELTIRDNRLYIRNLSETNYTYVNNVKIGTENKEIKNGDDLSLGGNRINGVPQKDAAYFTVRIG